MLDRTKAPEIRQIENLSIYAPERLIMPNGLPLSVIKGGNEDVIRFDILIKGGQWNQNQPLQATFTNRMLREGTTKYTSAQIAEKLDFYGAWLDMSSSFNCEYITLYTLGKYFPQTIEVLESIIKEPTFPEKELSVLLDSNRQQFLVNAERVEVMARKRLNKALFGMTHPLGMYAELEDYNRLAPDVLKAFYDRLYRSDNCSMYISGKVTLEVLHLIEEHFGNHSWGKVGQVEPVLSFKPTTENDKYIFLEKKDAMQSSLKMGALSMNRNHPDYLKTRVLVTLFGGYFGSRLMSNIREDKGYTYGISAALFCYPDVGVFMIGTEAGNEFIDPVIKEVYKEMDILRNEKVSEEELGMVKNYMLGEFCRAYESTLSLVDSWIFIENSGLDDGFFEHSLDAIREVTSDEILSLAQKHFCKENLIAVVAGKKV